MMIRVPQFRYPGSKAKLARELVKLMPQSGRRYVECFAGLANVYFRAVQTLKYESFWLNDIRTAEWLKAVKRSGHNFRMDYSDDLRKLYDKYKAIYLSDNRTDQSVIVEHYLGFNGGFYEASGSRVRYSGGPSAFGFQMNVKNASHLLHTTDTRITDYDYTKVLEELGEGDFLFCDPPYRGCNVGGYGPNDLDYYHLFDLLKKARFSWMMTHYRDELFERELWKPDTSFNVKSFSKLREEFVWTNYLTKK
jgi:site-specific DNA-adenine methylase